MLGKADIRHAGVQHITIRRRAIKHEPSKTSHEISKQAQKHCQTRNRHRKQTARGILIRKEEAQIIIPTQPSRARPKPTASRAGEIAPHGRVRIQHEVQVRRVVLGEAVATDFGTIQQNQSTKHIEGQARGRAKTLTTPQTP